jgi:polar amino acid transport system substrate-binding protein
MEMVDRRSFSMTLAAGMALAPGAALAQIPMAPAAGTPAPAAPSAGGSVWEQIQKRGTLRLGTINSEPWYFKDLNAPAGSPESWRGIGPGVARTIAQAMNVKLEFVETTWGGAVAGLQANQYDFIFMLDGTPERALAIDFLPVPILWYPISVLVRDGIKADTWEDLNKPEYNVAVTLGATTDTFATKVLTRAKINRFNKTDEGIASFQSGRTDFIVLVAPGTDAFAAKLKMGQSVVPKPAQWFAGGTGLHLEENRRWKDYLTTCVIYLYNSGKVQDIYEDYLKFRGMDPAKVHPIIREG